MLGRECGRLNDPSDRHSLSGIDVSMGVDMWM